MVCFDISVITQYSQSLVRLVLRHALNPRSTWNYLAHEQVVTGKVRSNLNMHKIESRVGLPKSATGCHRRCLSICLHFFKCIYFCLIQYNSKVLTSQKVLKATYL